MPNSWNLVAGNSRLDLGPHSSRAPGCRPLDPTSYRKQQKPQKRTPPPDSHPRRIKNVDTFELQACNLPTDKRKCPLKGVSNPKTYLLFCLES